MLSTLVHILIKLYISSNKVNERPINKLIPLGFRRSFNKVDEEAHIQAHAFTIVVCGNGIDLKGKKNN